MITIIMFLEWIIAVITLFSYNYAIDMVLLSMTNFGLIIALIKLSEVK
jgi:hypothetical protein